MFGRFSRSKKIDEAIQAAVILVSKNLSPEFPPQRIAAMRNQVDIYRALPRRQLQQLCKKHGIPANKTNEFMAEALSVLLNVPILNLALHFQEERRSIIWLLQ